MLTHRLFLLREAAEVALCSLPPNQLNLLDTSLAKKPLLRLPSTSFSIGFLFNPPKHLDLVFGPKAIGLPSNDNRLRGYAPLRQPPLKRAVPNSHDPGHFFR